MRVCLCLCVAMLVFCLSGVVPLTAVAAAHMEPPRHSKNDKGHGKPRNTTPPRHSDNTGPPRFANNGSGNNDGGSSNGGGGPPPNAGPATSPPKNPTFNNQSRSGPRGESQSRPTRTQRPPRQFNPGVVVGTVESGPIPDKKKRKKRTRQAPRQCDIIVPGQIRDNFWSPRVDLGDGEITAAEVGITSATMLALVGLLLLAMYLGYIIGYKDKERADTSFMRALLDAGRTR